MRLVTIISATRYLVLIPIVGLALAAAVLFVFGGIGLVTFLFNETSLAVEGHDLTVVPIFDLLQYVHQFLIGTVLYITSMGFYQLFIQEVPVPDWMKTESAEDLETSLVGVVIVVLAIEFLGAVFSGTQTANLLTYGAGIALPIAALALFLAVRHTMSGRREGRGSTGSHSLGGASGTHHVHHIDAQEAHDPAVDSADRATGQGIHEVGP
jgi:uncharacterized membrane protein YqhA